MSNDQHRNQRRTRKTARTARRRVKEIAKAQPPQLDPSLPMTRDEIEAAMEALFQDLVEQGPEKEARARTGDEGGKRPLSPVQVKAVELQKQLFRVVFGREPGEGDPLFWDRDREHEGAFPLDQKKESLAISKAFAAIGLRPEIAYAMALTGMIVTEANAGIYSEDDLLVWEEAIRSYVHQAETGVIPLTPNELTRALEITKIAVEQPNVIPLRMARVAKTPENRILAMIERELGSETKAMAAMTRLAALVALANDEELKTLFGEATVSAAAVAAAAGAEVDLERRGFDKESFQALLDFDE